MTTTGSAQLVDTSTEFGARVAERLDKEQVVWLTTVGPTGTPQPNPVWFLWHDGEFLLFSQPDRPKLRNIARNPRVALHLNSTESGGDVVVVTGTARVDDTDISAEEADAYVEKYTDGLVSISMTREQFFDEYSVLVRISPDRLRGF
ncbi:TIGR03667 family PPOX class F420-dependent oxidoreductase [Nocardia cyriacigeorgica]|uniref:TIGR03667 family PPOX class F420-dependent oxidoreductase n=1 Tax=Nocardia cyriacigeorgica TaxID=135487 RepID=A0A6P1D4M6_9NOCA|nr:TIGR03667 family PPOX class F420-dependent oxidoreductase [Nocardia cyriacigeorgica]NEW38993.1 TIGR03667 family PPOX class F420-dependent oxidoreductase [Nocardia cyriacigeorgica]NEW43873.1 TIGR03667 family PPOX class F420-dependent oxidoreductase [Nocardia cyriacigeorgica]NEW50280.1 TIGR03667 family PPOX class F420-dependent oxidoreductase [Nocardia cyriacigeorgica]NEW54979.1 TIGR03667 family PPOX class F420-dependent oxidoreductase [Nocardia cyriacigeorgica]